MFKTIILILSLVVISTAFEVSDIPQDCKYIDIYGSSVMDFKLTVFVNYGQTRFEIDRNVGRIEIDGDKYIFNSMIDALNYFYENGWEIQHTYNQYHFILRKIK